MRQASKRKRARSTRAKVGLSRMDGARDGGREFSERGRGSKVFVAEDVEPGVGVEEELVE
ncbi:hypothetical protein GQX74_011190 [Glossina fuscipes]|nr:hypothetical protein GQX74_011190 [Glossina fuscipes]